MLRFFWAALMVCAVGSMIQAAELTWEQDPYRIDIVLATRVPGTLGDTVDVELLPFLRERIDAAIGPAWKATIRPATGQLRRQLLTEMDSLTESRAGELLSPGSEKLLVVAVDAKEQGYEIVTREYDRHVDRLGPPRRQECRQASSLFESVFYQAWRAISPLMRIELDPESEEIVSLVPRASRFPGKREALPYARQGDVFLPYLRRMNHEGKLVENGIQVVPWTYLEVVESGTEQSKALVRSGTKRPFGARRRGRIEQVAVALRGESEPVVVRLRARTAPDKPLVGYDVYALEHAPSDHDEEPELVRMGVTDQLGEIIIPPGADGVRTLFIKHGNTVLARLPVAFGERAAIEVPIPDDDARLHAEYRLEALREELVDIVAQRNILISRVKQKIAEEEFDDAAKLMSALDQLPSRTHFNQMLARESRMHRSDDPQIQHHISRMISATEEIIAQYLDSQSINSLHEELRGARQGNS